MIGTLASFSRRGMRVPTVILLLVSVSVVACGPGSGIQPEAPGPRAALEPPAQVLVMPLGQKTQQELPYWTLESQRLVLAYFDIFLRHGFRGATNSQVTVADQDFETDALEFAFQSVDGDETQEWWSYVPVSGRVAHNGQYPDYVLFFDGLRFRIHGGGGARQTYDVPGAGKLEVDLEYILWDNVEEEVAAIGQLHQESYTSSPTPSSVLFKDLFESMAEEVVRRSPLGS